MNRRYRGRRKHTRRGSLILLLILTAVFLVSCVAGSNPLWVRGLFGLDVANYAAEPVTQTLETNGSTAASLCDMVEILVSNNTKLKEFHSTSQAVKYYRDEILNDMLRDNFMLYTGNSKNLSGLDTAYPQNVITTLIPEQDFENAVFRYFGGTSVSHKNGEVFEYLDRVGGYTAPLQPWDCEAEVRVHSLQETLHTYRMAFELATDTESESYFAIFVKRDDGTCYFYSLENL